MCSFMEPNPTFCRFPHDRPKWGRPSIASPKSFWRCRAASSSLPGSPCCFSLGCCPPCSAGTRVDSVRDAIPTLAAIMFAGLRLSAPIQAIFRSVNKLRGGLPDYREGALTLLELWPGRLTMSCEEVPSPAGVVPNRHARLDNVSYQIFPVEPLGARRGQYSPCHWVRA